MKDSYFSSSQEEVVCFCIPWLGGIKASDAMNVDNWALAQMTVVTGHRRATVRILLFQGGLPIGEP